MRLRILLFLSASAALLLGCPSATPSEDPGSHTDGGTGAETTTGADTTGVTTTSGATADTATGGDTTTGGATGVEVPKPAFECTPGEPGVVQPLWMAGGSGPRAETGKFGKPDAIFLDPDGILLAGDEAYDYEELHLFDIGTEDPTLDADWLDAVADFGANPGPGGAGPMEFRGISGFAQDPNSGTIYVVEQGNGRVQLIEPIPSAPYYQHAGFFGAFAADRDHPKDGEFVRLQAARTDSLGRLFLSDDAKDNAKSARRDIQVFSPDLSFEAKFGDASYGEPGQDGNLVEPENFVIDEARDRIYVCDEGPQNVVVYRYHDFSFVQRFGGFIATPNGIDIDAHGFIYVVDEGNETEGAFVRVFEPTSLTEVYHFGGYGDGGDPAPGLFNSPDTLIIDLARDLLIVADQGNDRIQGFRLSDIQAQACVRKLQATTPPRAVSGRGVTARIELLQPDGDWERLGFRKTGQVRAFQDGASVSVSPTSFQLHNGLGTVTLIVDTLGPVDLEFRVGGLTATAQVTVIDTVPAKTLAGVLSGDDLNWSADDGLIRIDDSVSVPPGETLHIGPGTLVMMGPRARIDTQGDFEALGTEEAPIYVFPEDRGDAWGQIEHHGLTAKVVYQNVFLTGGSNTGEARDPMQTRHCCLPLIRVHGGAFEFVRSAISDNAGKGLFLVKAAAEIHRSYFGHNQMGAELDTTYARVEDTWFVENRGPDDNDGLYIWGYMAMGLKEQQPQDQWEAITQDQESVEVKRCVVADGDDDGIDTRGTSALFEDLLIYGMADKGMSFTGAKPRVKDTLIFNNKIGMKVDYWTLNSGWFDKHDPPYTFGPILDGVTIAGNDNDGFRVSDRGGGDHDVADIQPVLDRVIIWGNKTSIHTDWTPDLITMNDSLTHDLIAVTGTGNITTPPIFIHPGLFDFRQNPHSPGLKLGAGWPGF